MKSLSMTNHGSTASSREMRPAGTMYFETESVLISNSGAVNRIALHNWTSFVIAHIFNQRKIVSGLNLFTVGG